MSIEVPPKPLPPEVPPKPSPRWQGLTATGRSLDVDNTPEPGRPVIINCHGHVEHGLCPACSDALRDVLHDVPSLLDDLDIAIAGWAKFVERGARPDSMAASAGLNPAVAAQQRLETALAGAADWFDAKAPWFIAAALATHLHHLHSEPRMPQLARDISQAASRAHKIIDSPVDWWFYGDCPDCDRPLLQERIHKDDQDTKVTCRYPSCNYSEHLETHQKKLLEAADDRWMTITELVAAFEHNGEPISRDRIEGLRRHAGLPRERRNKARYIQGRLVTSEVWVYRVGDIREMLKTRDKKVSA